MGVFLGFEVARLLREQGLRGPEMFIASGRNAPQFKWRDTGMQLLPDDEFVAAGAPLNRTPQGFFRGAGPRGPWPPPPPGRLSRSAPDPDGAKGPVVGPSVGLS